MSKYSNFITPAPGGNVMHLEDFDYELPKERIAQHPLKERDRSRLLVVHRQSGRLEDKKFFQISDYLEKGDVLVLNDTKVLPARFPAKKEKTGGKAELLLLRPEEASEASTALRWECLLKPALKEGQEVRLEDGTRARVIARRPAGSALVEFHTSEAVPQLAKRIGKMPLPPYIKRESARSDEETYQTVYASQEGAVAAPTAGLHFTKALLEELKTRGVELLYVTLHVGYGTFKPVNDLENHRMHAEHFTLSRETAERLNRARSEKRRVWAVGTTALRVLETCVQNKKVVPGDGWTDLFVKPPFTFEAVDRLITNFHLPRTTLLLLVAAFCGESLRKRAYEHALGNGYRFYSYGDAMLII